MGTTNTLSFDALSIRNKRKAEASLKYNLFPNTELCIDLKLFTREAGQIPEGTYLNGILTRDDDCHYTFIQNATTDKAVATIVKRNPTVYQGKFINVHQKQDGTLYPTFNRPPFTRDFTFRDFCQEAAEELQKVKSLVPCRVEEG